MKRFCFLLIFFFSFIPLLLAMEIDEAKYNLGLKFYNQKSYKKAADEFLSLLQEISVYKFLQ